MQTNFDEFFTFCDFDIVSNMRSRTYFATYGFDLGTRQDPHQRNPGFGWQ